MRQPRNSEDESFLSKKKDNLDFSIEKSLRYHQRRRAHYERLHKFVMLGIILSSSAAFAKVAGHEQIFALIGVLLGTLDLVFSFSLKARDHVMLHSEFTGLLADIRTAGSFKKATLGEWERRRLEIEAKELPIYWALEASCYNEVVHARGAQESGLAEIKWFQTVLMNWARFDKDGFPLKPPSANTR